MATRTARPAPAEWGSDLITDYPHGTPLLRKGKLQASRRNATFVSRPNTRTHKVAHVLVASHRIAIGSGVADLAAACDPVWIMLLDDMVEDATGIQPNGRCRRPGCAQLFTQADTEAKG